jgi:phosphatidylglycerophosphatase A
MGHYRSTVAWTTVWRDPALLVASVGGLGCVARAPGTLGTLAAVPIAWALAGRSLGAYLAVLGVAFALGVMVSRRAIRFTGEFDPQFVVWDEVVGYLVTMTAVPWDWRAAVLGFGLFRLFDIGKPGPVRWVERTAPGAWGVMLDDVAAGVLAWGCLQIISNYIT